MTTSIRVRGALAAVASTVLLSGTALGATASAEAAEAPYGTSSAPAPDATYDVTARSETRPLYDNEAGGNADADDPAIWRNPANPGRSLVIGTAKEGGLRVYDLSARQVQSIAAPRPPTAQDAPGRFNNVDLVSGLRLSTGRADVAVTTDRGSDRLRIYRIGQGTPLTDVTDPRAPWVFARSQAQVNQQRTAYGLATWTDPRSGRSFAIVSQRERTTLRVLELLPTRTGTVTYRTIRTVHLPSTFRLPNGTTWSPCGEPGELPQVEGMVVDPVTGTLYAGQEDVGIWRMRADLTGQRELMDPVREYGVPGTYDEQSEECTPGDDPGYGGTNLSADVEGLTLVTHGRQRGYLLASSQGDNTFAVYDRPQLRHIGGFRVVARPGGPDGSQESDGAAALAAPLGPTYPRGLLVVQDGHDASDDATNFTFVDLGEVLRPLKHR